MHARRVVITGMGLVSPHGLDAKGAFEAMLQGTTAFRMNAVGEAPHTTTIASAVCSDVDATPLLGKSRTATMDRFSHFAALAATSAWNDAGLAGMDEQAREQVCVMLGTATGGGQSVERGHRDLFVRLRSRLSPLTVVQCMNNAAGAHVAQLLGLGGACYTYSVACASSAAAIAEAARRVRAGECDVALGGGSEAALPYGTVRAWQSMQVLAAADETNADRACRPFSADRGGLVLGEGSAMLVLEELDHALARGARIYAELAGSGTSCDHGHITAPAASGQVRALNAALRDAKCVSTDVQYVNAHGTATPEGDPVEIQALRQCFGDHAGRLPVSATKSMHGHLMGASGAIEALITTLVVQTGRIPPTANLIELDPACVGVDHVMGSGRDAGRVDVAISNSFAFGGSNVVLVFRAIC
jgi:3-oxoacyl-[acyl-carrier-protein] synthase II